MAFGPGLRFWPQGQLVFDSTPIASVCMRQSEKIRRDCHEASELERDDADKPDCCYTPENRVWSWSFGQADGLGSARPAACSGPPRGVEVIRPLPLTEIVISGSAEPAGGCAYGTRNLVDQSAAASPRNRQG